MGQAFAENVAWVRPQSGVAHTLLSPLWFYDAPRTTQARYFDTYQEFVQPQKPSLLVVLANVPVYNPATDVLRARQARVFSQPDVLVQQSVWQLAPFGIVDYTHDVGHNTQAKFFGSYQEFVQTQKAVPLILSGTAVLPAASDIFKGQDTYGWPPDPTPLYWSPENRGTANALQFFTAYDYAHDVVGFRPQAKVFGEYQGYFTGQPVTANALNVFPVYHPNTDVTFLKPQAKVFDTYQEFVPYWQKPSIFTILPSPPPPPFLGPYAPVVVNVYDVQPGVTTSTCTVVWSASPGAPAYRLYVNGVPQTTTTTAQSATISGLAINTSYLFNVVVVNVQGNDASPLSNGVLYEHGASEFQVVNVYPWGSNPETGYHITYPLNGNV